MKKGKRGIVKVGIVFVILVILAIISLSLLGSASQDLGTYEVGDKVKLSLRGFTNPTLKIQTPSQILIEKTNKNFFILELTEPGEYIVYAKSRKRSQKFEFNVIDPSQNEIQEEVKEPIPEQIQAQESSPTNSTNNSDQIRIGQPVKNYHKVYSGNGEKTKINLPLSATGLSVDDPNANLQEQNSFLGNLFNGDEKQVVIENANGELIIEYETPGPEKTETQISNSKKQVTVSSEDGLHYEDVLAFTTIQEVFTLDEKDKIKVFWKEEGIYLEFEAFDKNGNGLIDYIEWIVPHLSTQNFDIILITDAMHLDSKRQIIEDVYDLVSERDKDFATIPEEEFLRITFETPLVPGKDITIYAQSEEGATIEVYEENSNELIATFENIGNYGMYKVILTELKHTQDTFDLKVISDSGGVQFDYAFDPTETLFVNSYDGTYPDWTEVGTSPYLNDTTGSYIYSKTDNVLEGNFGFQDSAVGDGVINDAIFYFEASADDAPGNDGFDVFVDNGTGFTNEGLIQPSSSTFSYEVLNVSHKFRTWTAVDAAEIYVVIFKSGGADEVYIQRAYLYINHEEPDLTAPNITLLIPVDGNETSNPSVLFNASLDDDGEGLKNATLYGNWSGGWHANETISVAGAADYADYTKTLNDGYYSWNVYGCDNSDNCQFNESNSSFRVDTTQPYINITSPTNKSNYSDNTIDVNYVVSDSGIGIDSCWYGNDTYASNTSLPGCVNITSIIWAEGDHNVTVWANDTLGIENSSYVNFFIDTINPTAILSTPAEDFLIISTPYLLNSTFSYDSGIGMANATWYYHNTTHSWIEIGSDLDASDGLTYSWSITEQDGGYNITANVSDLVGNEDFTTNENITIDLVNDDPTCTVLYPNGLEQINGQIFVNASVAETDPNDLVENVTFYYSLNNGTSWNIIGTNTTQNLPVYSLSWDTTSGGDSEDYLINCSVVDTRYGEYTDASNYNFTVDNSFPLIYDNYTNATDILINEYVCINSTVSDNIVGIKEVIASIEAPIAGSINETLYDNGLDCDTSSGDGVYSYAHKSTYEGIYNLTGIHAIDNLDNAVFNASNLNWTVTSNSYLIANMLSPTGLVEINESDQNTFFEIQCNITCDVTGGNCLGTEISAEYDVTGIGGWASILPSTPPIFNNETTYSCGDLTNGDSCFAAFNISAGNNSGGDTWGIRCYGESTNAAAGFSPNESVHVNDHPEALFAYPPESDWLSGTETLNASDSTDSDGSIVNYIFEIDDNAGFTSPYEICNGASDSCVLDTKAQTECSNETSTCYLKLLVLENDGLTNETIIQVGIDNIGATVDLDLPLNNSFINSETQIVNATAADSGSGVSCVEFSAYYDAGWNTINVDCVEPYSYGWDLSSIPDQKNIEVRAKANDSENNSGIYEPHGNITHDISSPTVNIHLPDNNTIFPTTQKTFNFTPEEYISDYMNCSIYINNLHNQSNASTINATTTEFIVSGFAQGDYFWFVNCTDEAGNQGKSETRKFSIDLQAPNWSLQNQSRGLNPITRYYKGEEINLSAYWEDNYPLENATLSTNESGIWENKSGFYNSPQEITGGNLTSFNWSNTTLENGSFVSWRIYGNDSAGNVNATDILSFRVWGYSEISQTYLYPSGIPEGGTTTIYCGVRDNISLGVLEGYSVSFYDEGAFLGTNTTKDDGLTSWTFSKSTAGTYTILCNITDNSPAYYAASSAYQGQAILGVGYGFRVYDYTNLTYHHAYEGTTTDPTAEVSTYIALEYNDGATESHTVDQTSAYAYQNFDLRIDQSEAQIIDFNVTWTGYGLVTGTGTDGYILYLWNETLGGWQTEVTYTGGATEQTDSLYYSSGFEDFINASGFVQVLVRTFDPDTKNPDSVTVGTNYIKVEIKYDILGPVVELFYPVNYLNSSDPTVTFNCSADDDQNIANVSLETTFTGSWEINETNATGVNNVNYSFTETPSEGNYLWNCKACDVSGNCEYASVNRTLIVDTTPPVVNLTYPGNDTNFSSYQIDSFNYTVGDANSIINCSLYGDWISGWHLNETFPNPERGGNQNFSNNNVSTDGYYVWNILCFDYSGNSAFNSTNFSFSAFYPVDELNASRMNVTQTRRDGNGNVILAWDFSSHAEEYFIYSALSPGGPFTYLDQTSALTYTDTTASNDRRRFYRVSSWNPSSENISDKVFGKTVYYFERSSGTNTRNWMSLYLTDNLTDASEALSEISNITSFNYWNSTIQTRVTCNTFSCPSFPGCPPETCDFLLVNGSGYEINTNATLAQYSNWSWAGEIKPPKTLDLITNSTSFGLNWIGIYGNTTLTDADGLYATLTFTDAMTSWDQTQQTSIPYIPYPWPHMPLLGENFNIEPEKAYEVSVTQDTTYTQT